MDTIQYQGQVAPFTTAKFDHMQRVAKAMSAATLVPKHLQGSMADCLMVCQQADRWGMDPFAVAQCTFVLHGRLGYEGKLVAAVINARSNLTQRLSYGLEGDGQNMSVTVSAKFAGENEERTIKATVKEAKTDNKKWSEMPDQMLCYYGARKWARRHAPELMLGVMSEDEMEAMRPMKDVTPPPVNLEEENIVGAGETEPGTKPKGKRVKVTFRGKEMSKTDFMRDAAQLLKLCDGDEVASLVRDLKDALWSIPDEDTRIKLTNELDPRLNKALDSSEDNEPTETQEDFGSLV